MYTYAQIDKLGICISISQLSGEIKSHHMIPLQEDHTVNLGDVYTEGKWVPKDNISTTSATAK